jgi:predicted phosphate transport protein (TIGR00153 family)
LKRAAAFNTSPLPIDETSMPEKALCGLVARSPFKQLRSQFEQVHGAVQLLLPLLRGALDEDWQRVQLIELQIRELSQESERVSRDVCLHLPSTLFMPIPRSDVLDLLRAQDSLAHCASEIARLVALGRMRLHPAMQDEIRIHLLRAVDTVTHVMAVVEKLDELLESRFRGHEAVLVQTMINELINIEYSSRQRRDEATIKLLGMKDQLPAAELMTLDRLIEFIAGMAAQAKQVGLRLEQLLAN